MIYTEKQIASAKLQYDTFLTTLPLSYFESPTRTHSEAYSEWNEHNSVVDAIREGDVDLEKKWKLFFLSEEVKSDRKRARIKAELAANKEASADILAPIKSLRKLGAFGKWLNTPGNEFRKQHFNKKYTVEAVNAFLSTL